MSLDLSTVQHHHALEEIVDVLCTKRRTKDRSFFQAEVAYFLGKLAASMRATIATKNMGDVPVNIYALALAPSGYGKGHSITILEDEFLKRFKERFLEDTFPIIAEQNLWVIANKRAARNGSDQQEEFDKARKEFERYGPFVFTFDSGTTAGVKEMRNKLLLADIGSINYQVDEIGSNLLGSTDMLTLYLELYDNGKVKQKLTKNSNENPRGQEIDGKTPANMLLFGTPAKVFDGSQTEEQFYSLLETGYARRCIFGYGQIQKGTRKLTAEEVYKQLTAPSNDETVKKWATTFYELADPARYGWRMLMPDDVAVAHVEYQLACEALAETLGEHEEIQKAELSHRHSKALKLAGVYAFIDQSTEIEMHHLLSAIKLVEESGQAFSATLTRDKTYVKLAKYIAQVGTEVTHADLVNDLPYYPKSSGPRNDMLMLATSWGYKNHIIIKKTFTDGIEFFKGETLQETDLDKVIVSYSQHWAYNYLEEKVPFDKLHVLAQAEDMHWANHHFVNGHRADENVKAGFNLVAIDMDGGMPLHMAHELMRDYKFLTYTTKSHTDDDHRYRMIFPTNYLLELDQEEYREFMNSIMNWLPFPIAAVEKGKVVSPGMDASANQRCKKWATNPNAEISYNLDGQLLDVLPFIPKTSRNEQYKQQNQQLDSLDNLERWFAQRIASGNRNNQMIKYALCLVDSGWALIDVRNQVHAFNKKLSDPMSESEIDSTIMVTVAKRYGKP